MSISNAIGESSVGTQAGIDTHSPSLVAYLTIAVQFALFLVLAQQFNLVSRAFLDVGVVTFIGWMVHYLLPQRYRLQLGTIYVIAPPYPPS